MVGPARPAVFIVALDETTATHASTVLLQAGCVAGGVDDASRPRVTLLPRFEDLASHTNHLDGGTSSSATPEFMIIYTDLARWLSSLIDYPKNKIIYLRPSLMCIIDTLLQLPSHRNTRLDFYNRILASVDARLSAHIIWPVEQLFYEPAVWIERLCDLPTLNWRPDTTGLQETSLAAEALEQVTNSFILSTILTGDTGIVTGLRGLRVGETYATTIGEAGLSCLGDGWSWPEYQHTWATSDKATLHVCIDPSVDVASAPLTLRLAGVAPCRPFRMEASCGPRVLATVQIDPGASPEVAVDIPLPEDLLLRGDLALDLNLRFDQALCPSSLGMSGDTRVLRLALRELTLRHAFDPVDFAPLRRLIASCRFDTVVSLDGPPPEQAHAFETYLTTHTAIEPPDVRFSTEDWLADFKDERSPPFDLVIAWNPGAFMKIIGAMTLADWCNGDLFVRTNDPELFNASWWSAPSTYDRFVSDFEVEVVDGWIAFRRARSIR